VNNGGQDKEENEASRDGFKKSYSIHLWQLIELAREPYGHEILTSMGIFNVLMDENSKLVIQCQQPSKDVWTSVHPLSITWDKGKMPSEKALLQKYVYIIHTN
jgi:hypothetical protein